MQNEPICLAYVSSPGVSEHYDGCIKLSLTDQYILNEDQDQKSECQTEIQKENQDETYPLSAIEIAVSNEQLNQ